MSACVRMRSKGRRKHPRFAAVGPPCDLLDAQARGLAVARVARSPGACGGHHRILEAKQREITLHAVNTRIANTSAYLSISGQCTYLPLTHLNTQQWGEGGSGGRELGTVAGGRHGVQAGVVGLLHAVRPHVHPRRDDPGPGAPPCCAVPRAPPTGGPQPPQQPSASDSLLAQVA